MRATRQAWTRGAMTTAPANITTVPPRPPRVAPNERPLGWVPSAGSASLAAPQLEALAALLAGVADKHPLILLTGDAGTGKTTLARGLLERLDPDRNALGGMFGPYGEGEALGAHTVQNFAVRPPRPGANFLSLEDFLGQGTSGGREAVLVLDEAQALDTTALAQLRHLVASRADRRLLLQVVLVCVQIPPAVDAWVRDSELVSIGARIHLRRLRHAETRDLVLRRLQSRAQAPLPAFSPEALMAIHDCSAGVMRRASQLCDRILMWLALEGVRDVSAQVVHAVDAQISGEWSGLKSDEPRPAASADVEPLTSAQSDLPAQTSPAPGPRAPAPDARLASVRSPSRGFTLPFASARAPAAGLAPPTDAPSPARTDIAANPKAAGPAVGPPVAAERDAKAGHLLSAGPRAGRRPTKRLMGLLLGLAVLGGLALQWPRQAPEHTPGPQRAAIGSTVQIEGEARPQTQAPAPVTTAPAAAPEALPTPSPPSRPVSSPPPPERAAPGAGPTEPPPPMPTSARCSGPVEALGLCAVAAPAQPATPASPTTDAPPASARPTCTAERAALGLCDTP